MITATLESRMQSLKLPDGVETFLQEVVQNADEGLPEEASPYVIAEEPLKFSDAVYARFYWSDVEDDKSFQMLHDKRFRFPDSKSLLQIVTDYNERLIAEGVNAEVEYFKSDELGRQSWVEDVKLVALRFGNPANEDKVKAIFGELVDDYQARPIELSA